MPTRRHLPTRLLVGLALPGLVACLPADIHARSGSVRATHRLSYTTSNSHGCSRSYAITRHNGSMSLRIGRHRATLTMDDIKYYRFGSARRRYRPHQPRKPSGTTRRTRRQFTWRGKVTKIAGGGASMVLTPKTTTCTALPLYGTKGGRKYKCRSTPSVTLRCKVGTAMAYRRNAKGGFAAMIGKQEKSRAVAALRCTATGLPRLLHHARYKHALLFARKPGLSLYSRSGRFLGRRTQAHLRR